MLAFGFEGCVCVLVWMWVGVLWSLFLLIQCAKPFGDIKMFKCHQRFCLNRNWISIFFNRIFS